MADVEVARYRIGRLLGSGGRADVFPARDVERDRPVALKLLSLLVATEPCGAGVTGAV